MRRISLGLLVQPLKKGVVFLPLENSEDMNDFLLYVLYHVFLKTSLIIYSNFPASVQNFFLLCSFRLFFTCSFLNARISGYLDLKFHNLSTFYIFSIDFADFESRRGHIVKF